MREKGSGRKDVNWKWRKAIVENLRERR